jgi:hypothetical protein
MTELSYSPRETAPQGTRVTSLWIDGSRDRYGEALFVSNATALLRDGSERQSWIVWQNRRPYAPNVKVCELAERPETWAQLDAALSGIEPDADTPVYHDWTADIESEGWTHTQRRS